MNWKAPSLLEWLFWMGVVLFFVAMARWVMPWVFHSQVMRVLFGNGF